MVSNILTQKVSDQLNIYHIVSLKCVGGYCHKYIQQQSNVQKTLLWGRSKTLTTRRKRKTTTQAITKLFNQHTKAKKNIPDFLVHRRLAQAHKQATYNYWYSERGMSRIIFLIALVESFEPSFKQFFSEDSLPCGINVYDRVCFGK